MFITQAVVERERALVRLQKELQEEERKERAAQWERFMAYRNQLVRGKMEADTGRARTVTETVAAMQVYYHKPERE